MKLSCTKFKCKKYEMSLFLNDFIYIKANTCITEYKWMYNNNVLYSASDNK